MCRFEPVLKKLLFRRNSFYGFRSGSDLAKLCVSVGFKALFLRHFESVFSHFIIKEQVSQTFETYKLDFCEFKLRVLDRREDHSFLAE